jgi:hypothetical protein
VSLSSDEAAAALSDIAKTEIRSSRAYRYRQASPNLIVWGALWAGGYGLTDVWPHRGAAIWIAIVPIGLAISFLIGMRSAARSDPPGPHPLDPSRTGAAAGFRWGFPATMLTAFIFIAATLAVMAPVSGRQVGAFIPLVVAASYALAGIWCGLRFIVAGAAIVGLTLAGFFLLPAHFNLWMAAVGGGALVLAGLWLRSA